MLLKIILLLTITPLVELFLLIRLAELTSTSFAILLVIATGIVGGVLAKIEGLRVVTNLQHELAGGKLPADALLDGAMVLVAGALLLTPGIITDAIGFTLLCPPARKLIRKYLKEKLRKMVQRGNVHIHSEMGFGPISREPPPGAPPLEDEPQNTEQEARGGNSNE